MNEGVSESVLLAALPFPLILAVVAVPKFWLLLPGRSPLRVSTTPSPSASPSASPSDSPSASPSVWSSISSSASFGSSLSDDDLIHAFCPE
jgi:hypothetical protein